MYIYICVYIYIYRDGTVQPYRLDLHIIRYPTPNISTVRPMHIYIYVYLHIYTNA